MLLVNTFVTEFLAETNLVITQEDFGNKLNELLSPIKNLINKQTDFLSFSLARYSGASSRLAFFSEWHYLTLKIRKDPTDLVFHNQQYWQKKVDAKFRQLENVLELVDADIMNCFLPQQIAFLESKNRELIDDQLVKYPNLGKYLNNQFLGQVTVAEFTKNKLLYGEKMTINKYLELQAGGLSFAMLGLPCLLGFLYNFNQEDSIVNPKAVKWVILEDLLRQISALHQTGLDSEFVKFVFSSKLNDEDLVLWHQLTDREKTNRAKTDAEAVEVVETARAKIYQNAIIVCENLVFPEKYKTTLRDLLEWAYKGE